MTTQAARVKWLTGTGTAALYVLSAPTPYETEDGDLAITEYVAVSSILPGDAPLDFPAETMIFPADSTGRILSYLELARVRTYAHVDALAALDMVNA